MFERTSIIAEAGVNHNGSLELAKRLIDVAAEAGADFVKFQTFKSSDVLTSRAQKADYQKARTDAHQNQLDMVRKLELSPDDHFELVEHCKSRSIALVSTPFDIVSANFLVDDLKVDFVKVSSGDLTNAPFLLHLAGLGAPILLSTGMGLLGEIEDALGVLAFGYLKPAGVRPERSAFCAAYRSAQGQFVLAEKVSLLHCTTEYPAPIDCTNLRAMDTLKQAFGLRTGFSDHTPGIHVPIAAVARGASIIEKHLTLDREMSGPDHRASLEPAQFADMVSSIRDVEQALGSGRKMPTRAEISNMTVARRSIVAARKIEPGEVFSADMLTTKRPGDGLAPMELFALIGRPARRAYAADEAIDGVERG
ncbi:N-acetylneuraminate synthase [Bradyrhizobium manausense]|uniref:N-acetylneuraminate synthase n=1 Tax=Bradyrhizobium manausense TaxID=989370 RepID=UPI001BA577EE|nr:N-acetylneuraminate synthase [Bradyrhizobium manausense]MBR0826178.1 N-acetylneuraminate synthase [Bradyrhizobium manausense]